MGSVKLSAHRLSQGAPVNNSGAPHITVVLWGARPRLVEWSILFPASTFHVLTKQFSDEKHPKHANFYPHKR